MRSRGPRTPGRGLLFLVLGLWASGSGCRPAEGDPGRPTWLRLAALHDSGPALLAGDPTGLDGWGLREDGDDLWLETELAPEAWSKHEAGGVWGTPQPALALGGAAGGRAAYRLTRGGEPLTHVEDSEALRSSSAPAFTVVGRELRVRLEEGESPRPMTFGAIADPGGSDGGRVVGRRFGGEGFAVRPAREVALTVDVPAESALGFATSIEPAVLSREARLAPRRFVVELDGEPILDHVQEGTGDTVVWHRLPLPPEGGRARVSFRVEGPFAFTAFHEPVIGPAEIGGYGERPWAVEHPDVVLFVADTLRADALELYGGEPGLAPGLNRLAAEARAFRNAWSVSTHTLPTHSSMFSGLFPRQNGQVDYWNPLPRAIETVAERFLEAGYRTVAVTDGIMVSQSHGLAQGFAWFDERRRDLAETRTRLREALAADDGRPLFCFVQTYAVHAPYRVRPETREALGAPEADFDQLLATLEREHPEQTTVDMELDPVRRAVADLRALYLGAVVDLDREFTRIRTDLEEAGLFGSGYLLFTSDHGEAFAEHSELFHAGTTYEEQLRVPLLLLGPDVKPGVDDRPVSLIDVAPTLAELTGLPPRGDWVGRSLLSPAAERPIFAFQCRDNRPRTTLAVIEGRRKLIGYETAEALAAGDWLGAYDLASDPTESRNALDGPAEWPAEMGVRFAPALEALLQPLHGAEATHLTPEAMEAIRDMGYGGL